MAEPALAGTNRPSVVLSDRQQDAVVDDALRALQAANDPPQLFVRGGRVVGIVRDEDSRSLIRGVEPDALYERLISEIDWYRRGRGGSFQDTEPSRKLASTVLQRLMRDVTALPPLRGLVESPILRPNGSIHNSEGYDPETRLYYAPEAGFTLAPVPETVTERDYADAVGLLDELLGDFPFRADADKASAFAEILSPTVRNLCPGPAPIHLNDAPAPGTGKGHLSKVVGIVSTGRIPAMMSPPGDREDAEWRKRITAVLLDGSPLAIVDNVEEPLGSASLASVLTADHWTDRLLGRSESVTIPARTVWIATGNNLRLRGDLPRRAVWCRLDAKLARPWTREKFKHPDLLGWAREHRGDLLAALFTLVRGWIQAGRPGPDPETPKLGGYEPWRQVVGGILRLAGIQDFLGNLAELYDAVDEETPAWCAFLSAWKKTCPLPITSAALTATIRGCDELHDALPPDLADALADEKQAKSFTRKLGKALSRHEETRFPIADGMTLRIARGGEEHRAVKWEVRDDG